MVKIGLSMHNSCVPLINFLLMYIDVKIAEH